MLRVELAILHEEDYNLDLVGFDDVELQRLLEAQDNAPGLTDADAVPEVQADPVSKLGDLWRPRESSAHLRRLHRSAMSSRGCSATRSRSC